MGNSLLKPCHIWSAHSPTAAPSPACGWHWSLSKLTNWPFTTPSLRYSKAALMITRPDTVTGAAEQSLTPPALPFYPNTYCSLFVTLIHKHHRGLVTLPQCDHWKVHLQPLHCLSDYLFPLYLSCRTNKAWSRLWDGNQELNISAFIKLSVIKDVFIHTKFAQPTKMGERVKQDERSWRESLREDRLGEEGKTNEREMKREATSGGNNCHCSPESISTQTPTAFIQPYFLQDVKVLLFMWEGERGRQVYSKTMWRNATPVSYAHCVITRSLVSWEDLVNETLAAITVCLHCIYPKLDLRIHILKLEVYVSTICWPLSRPPLFWFNQILLIT